MDSWPGFRNKELVFVPKATEVLGVGGRRTPNNEDLVVRTIG